MKKHSKLNRLCRERNAGKGGLTPRYVHDKCKLVCPGWGIYHDVYKKAFKPKEKEKRLEKALKHTRWGIRRWNSCVFWDVVTLYLQPALRQGGIGIKGRLHTTAHIKITRVSTDRPTQEEEELLLSQHQVWNGSALEEGLLWSLLTGLPAAQEAGKTASATR